MREKRLDFELLRLLAIVGVVFNHTQRRGFELYQVAERGSFNYVASLLLGTLCKVAVPLFFLISGGLLLHRREAISQVLRKRVLRIVVVLVLFSGILYGFWIAWGYVESPGLWDFLSRLWSSGVSIPYWYLYAYLGILLMLPLLRPMVQALPDKAFGYLLGVHVVVFGLLGTLASLGNLGTMHEDFQVALAEPYLFYFLLGYYLDHRLDWSRVGRRQLGALWLAAILAVAVMLGLAHLAVLRTGTAGLNYHRSLMVFPVLAIYVTVHLWMAGRRLPKALETLLGTLGGCVFGTYLLEGILRHTLSPLYEFLEPRIHVLPACLIWVLAVVLCGLGITYVLKKLPVFRKLL